VIINTDGWVAEEDAIYYKIRLVEELSPDIVFCIQQQDELAPLLSALEKFRKTVIESPPAIGQRSKERRKNLRELGYIKYLRNSKVMSLPLSWLRVEKSDVFGLNGGQPNPRAATKIYALLGMKPLHFTELKDRISVIIGKTRWISTENLKKTEESTKKKIVIVRKGEEEGILLGLYDAKRKFKGIGVLQEIDYLRKTLKILTPVSKDIAIVVMGKLKLDKNLKEIPNPQDQEALSA
jgi:polynucleotide 5'-kinase involved in rRNA processing